MGGRDAVAPPRGAAWGALHTHDATRAWVGGGPAETTAHLFKSRATLWWLCKVGRPACPSPSASFALCLCPSRGLRQEVAEDGGRLCAGLLCFASGPIAESRSCHPSTLALQCRRFTFAFPTVFAIVHVPE